MGSYLRLIKAVDRESKKIKKSAQTDVVETEEDKEFVKYLESLSDSELNKLYQAKLAEIKTDPSWIKERKRLETLTESELMVELQEQLKKK